jgi:hypothetical protein
MKIDRWRTKYRTVNGPARLEHRFQKLDSARAEPARYLRWQRSRNSLRRGRRSRAASIRQLLPKLGATATAAIWAPRRAHGAF